MTVLNPVQKTAVRGLALFVAAMLVVPAVTVSVASAQVGPQLPREKPKRENNVSKVITNLFKGKDEAEDAETASPKEVEAEKPQVVAPPAEEKPQAHHAKHPPMLSQPPLTGAQIEDPQVDDENPPVIDHPKLDDPSNPLGLADAANRLKHLAGLVDNHRYVEAKPELIRLRQWLIDLTEAHIGLYKTLNQIPSARAQAELEKTLALQFAQLRDRAMVETARVYIAEKDYPRAVKELTEVVKSQPRSKVGLWSYELLQEIGFTEKLQLAQ